VTRPHQCPCCDYFTLDRRGEYLICPVCFWEDDGNDLSNLDRHSGPNHMTLGEARKNFHTIGACAAAMVPNVLSASGRTKFALKPR
jgi:hypothetical protein